MGILESIVAEQSALGYKEASREMGELQRPKWVYRHKRRFRDRMRASGGDAR